jgi:hypothetical protein
MAKLTDEEKKLLAELTAREAEGDEEDFEVHVWNGDKGATLPVSKAKSWLYENFGIGEAPAAPAGDGGGGQGGKSKADPKPPERKGGYFGGRAAG